VGRARLAKLEIQGYRKQRKSMQAAGILLQIKEVQLKICGINWHYHFPSRERVPHFCVDSDMNYTVCSLNVQAQYAPVQQEGKSYGTGR